MAQRGMADEPGLIVAKVVDDAGRKSIMPHVPTKVLPESVVYTNKYTLYDSLGKEGHQHDRVHHSAHVYVSGDAYTNTIDGFWSHLKGGISGVSTKHLQSYLDGIRVPAMQCRSIE